MDSRPCPFSGGLDEAAQPVQPSHLGFPPSPMAIVEVVPDPRQFEPLICFNGKGIPEHKVTQSELLLSLRKEKFAIFCLGLPIPLFTKWLEWSEYRDYEPEDLAYLYLVRHCCEVRFGHGDIQRGCGDRAENRMFGMPDSYMLH